MLDMDHLWINVCFPQYMKLMEFSHCEVSGFCHGVVEVFTFLRCYAVQVSSWSLTVWDSLLFPSSRVK